MCFTSLERLLGQWKVNFDREERATAVVANENRRKGVSKNTLPVNVPWTEGEPYRYEMKEIVKRTRSL